MEEVKQNSRSVTVEDEEYVQSKEEVMEVVTNKQPATTDDVANSASPTECVGVDVTFTKSAKDVEIATNPKKYGGIYKVLANTEHMEKGKKVLETLKADELGALVYNGLKAAVKEDGSFLNLDDWMMAHCVGLDALNVLRFKQTLEKDSKDVEVNALVESMYIIYQKSKVSRRTEDMIEAMKMDEELMSHVKKLDEMTQLLVDAIDSKDRGEKKKKFEEIYEKANGMGAKITDSCGKHVTQHLDMFSEDVQKIYTNACSRILCSDVAFMEKVQEYYPIFAYEHFDGTLWMMMNFAIVSASVNDLKAWDLQAQALYKGINEEYEGLLKKQERV